MKLLKLFLLSGLYILVTSFSETIDKVRSNYSKATSNEEICKEMIKALEKNHSTNELLAYYGAYNAIFAKHIFNPSRKLASFDLGKSLIEQAVKKDSRSVEVRFVRLSVQKNCPSILGYNSNIKSDTDFIKKHRSEITSSELIKMVDKILEN